MVKTDTLPDTGRVTVVRATADEADDVILLIGEYQDAVGVVVRDSTADIRSSLSAHGKADSGEKAIWLAYADGEPVGCVAFRLLQHSERAGEIKRLYVRPARRGHGVAQCLMQEVEAYAIERGCTRLYLDSKDDLVAAVRFYDRLGYVRCARYNDNPQATIFMMKELVPPVDAPGVTVSPLAIRPFEAADAEAFRVLNEAWITKLFHLEAKDREVLGDPVGKIIEPGGQIFVAVRDGEVIGCCGLIAMGEGAYELSKMAVAEQERGRGAGRQLLEWIVGEMRRQGARRLYLETNSTLKNAIHLYQAVGFRHVPTHGSLYERADVSMELLLTS